MKLPNAIKVLLENYCGINYEVIGTASIAFLVKNRKIACGLPSDEAYFKYLISDKDEFNNFVEGLLVPETWFFRDTNPFIHLTAFSKTFGVNKCFFRALSLACATGEETYSIAMTLLNSGWSSDNFCVYGIDLGQKSLDIAQKGVYSKSSFYPQDPCDKSLFFDQTSNNLYSVKDTVRKSVHFMQGNIIDPTLFRDSPPFHAIFARNILIYFALDARKLALDNIDRLLLPNGHLFLGHADNISILTDKFKSTGQPSAFVFEKALPADPKLPRNKTQQMTPHFIRHTTPPLSSNEKADPKNNSDTPAHPKPNFKFLEKAREFANKGLFRQSKTYIDKYIKIHGPSADAYFLTGQIFAAQNKLDSAEDAYKKAIYLDSNHLNALFQLELLCIGKGDLEQAKILRERLIRIKDIK